MNQLNASGGDAHQEYLQDNNRKLLYAVRMRDAWTKCVDFGFKYAIGSKFLWNKEGQSKPVTMRTVPTVIAGVVCISIEEDRAMVAVTELTPV